MQSRSAPDRLAPTVRQQLADELAQLRTAARPRGRRGQRHDRLETYLVSMVENTVESGAAETPAQAGDRVSVRFDGDVEHRTYRLYAAPEDGETEALGAGDGRGADCPALPMSWPLGQAVDGLTAGTRFTYQRPDGDTQQAQLLAVWDGQRDGVWQLPAQESDTGPSRERTGGPNGS